MNDQVRFGILTEEDAITLQSLPFYEERLRRSFASSQIMSTSNKRGLMVALQRGIQAHQVLKSLPCLASQTFMIQRIIIRM